MFEFDIRLTLLLNWIFFGAQWSTAFPKERFRSRNSSTVSVRATSGPVSPTPAPSWTLSFRLHFISQYVCFFFKFSQNSSTFRALRSEQSILTTVLSSRRAFVHRNNVDIITWTLIWTASVCYAYATLITKSRCNFPENPEGFMGENPALASSKLQMENDRLS